MKSKNTLLLLFLLLGINNAFSQFTPQKPDLRLCGSPPDYYEDFFNCTSNNYTLDHVFLSLTNVNGVPLSNTTCTPGTSQQMYVMLNYTSNSNSNITQTRIFADLSIDGLVIPLNVYLGNIVPGAGQRQIYGPFTWTCGQELALCRILAVWKTSGNANDPELSSYNCGTYSKSQCEFGSCMVVAAPLAVEFDYTVCTSGNLSAATFQNETSGGIAPYSYSWNFGDGSPVSTQQNPTHNFPYPGGPYTVTLTVTDSNLPTHLVSSYTQVITPPAPISVSGQVNAASCSSNNNGSIDITVTGGTPIYTYSWSNGVTTQDLSGLNPGTYTVTVTDSFGCVKSQSYVIGSGDVSNPVVTAPNDLSLEGCGTAAIASQGYLAFSTTPVVITLAQFTAAGGNYTDTSAIATITYQDIASGSCPTVVTRTFRLTDACGNMGSDVQIISIDDTQAPVISALPAPTTIVCPATPQFAQATATDVCDQNVTLTFADVTTPGNCIRSYTTVRTWTATDDCGNSSTASQSITVIDNVPPVAPSAPTNVTVSCGSLVPAMISLTANDACCGPLTVPGVDNITPGQCSNSYVIIRTWTFVDACGNTSSVSQTITVNDNVAPVVPTPPANITVACGSLIPAMISLTANDACNGPVTVPGVDAVTPGQCINSYIVTRTWTFVDACGNTSSVSQTITVNDNVAPVVPTPPANVTVACGSLIPAMVSLTANDACSGPITVPGVDAVTPGQCVNSYVVIRTWTFLDACGNSSTASQTITVNDNIPPVAPAAPANITVACSSLVPTAAVLSANDNCGGSVTGVPNDVVTPGSCPNSYTVVRTWTFTDSCGNSSTASQTIIVNDNIPPVAPAAPANITVACSSLVPTAAVLSANDNCGGSVTGVPNDVVTPGSCPNSYTVVRTWTFTDSCGNSSTASQTITVNDNIPPVAPAAPANITVACSSLVPTAAVLSANDNCGGSVTGVPNDVVTPGSCPNSYTVVRTWTFTDSCGNSSTASQTITVNDNIPPVAPTAPANITVACSSLVPTAAVLSANDNCGGSVTGVPNDVVTPGSCPNSYTVVRTWTFTDSCGNSSTASQTIIVNDNIPPVAPAAPANITVACSGLVPAMISLTATDNCNGSITVPGVDSITSGNCASSYTITRTWTFVDGCGNTTSISQTINVSDTSSPSLPQAPANVTVACSADVPAMISLTATDSCAGPITSIGVDAIASGNCPNSYVITRTWSFGDLCGNTSSVSQTITVNDNIAPVVPTAPANVTVSCSSEVPAMISLTANDNCQGQITVQGVDAVTPGDCVNSFIIVRTWTFVDACNNTSSVSQTITVDDTIAPVPPSPPVKLEVFCSAEVPAPISLTAIDNCSGSITALGVDSVVPGDCPNSFVITRTWTFTDACNNTSVISQIIEVEDTIPPVLPQAPANITVACGAEVPEMISLTTTDNCQANITVQGVDSIAEGQCVNSYVITRTWTFVDACGNTSSVSQTINVSDILPPVLPQAPADVTVACGAEVPEMISLTATDNCQANITVQGVDSIAEGQCVNSYVITRTWTFVDACGNTSSVSQTINVSDVLPPVLPQAPADVTVACGAEAPAMISLTATDNCQGEITVEGVDSIAEGQCVNSYVITRTWTFVDACGNTSSVSQTINVSDVLPPVLPQAPADVTVACGAEVPAMISLTATDNCQGEITVEGVDSIAQGSCINSYVITRTWTFVDACGNTSSVSQTINVSDILPPVLPQAPADVTVACGAEVPEMISLTATDNCQGEITVQGVDSIAEGSCINSYVITRTWTFTDACNNTSSVSQTISVSDILPPVLPQAPADVTVACGAEVPAMISLTATDNCQGEITVQGVDSIAEGQCVNSYVITRTWTFVDACGNTSSVSQTINVSDVLPPVLPQAPADVTVACGAEVPAMISLTATDNCQGEITVQGVDSIAEGSCINSYVITRTWTFVDACGNTSSVSQTINVSDVLPPVLPQAPADVTVACGAEVPAMISLTATDNCQGEITVEGVDSIAPGECASSFVVTRTWTFVDACNNTSSVSQTITVNDTIPPTLPPAPIDIAVSCSGEVPPSIWLTAVDNCGGEITVLGEDLTTNLSEGTCVNAYIITRTWTFVDGCGNTSSITQVITVNDEIAPILENEDFQSEMTVTCANIPDMPVLTFSDNCGGSVTVESTQVIENQVMDENDLIISYDIIRTWTATDTCGNTTVITQTIHVNVGDNFNAGTKELCSNDSANANYNLNQLLNGLVNEDELDGTWTIENAGFESVLEGNILDVTALPIGYYTLVYNLDTNDSFCPRKYEFYIHVLDDCGVLAECSINVFNAVSPNQDGLNEVLYIDGITCYAENNVKIYNRWGILVYDESGYNNADIAFNGVSEGRSTLNKGEELPDGTYFYILKYRSNETGNWLDKSGYLYLNR